ncbi:MAG: DUF4384 domain-containing protein [Spirochaetaceae bacterium]|nr:DUF4384 domain-containing protein [Spirochaetaceae bacterium]
MKKIPLICFFTVLIIHGSWSFEWSLGFLSDNPGINGRSLSRPLPLRDGNEFTIHIKSETSVYCYVIARDSENSVHVLNNSVLEKDQELLIGPLEITPPSGQELFYVVMSGIPQRALENFIRLFEMNTGSPKAAEDLMGEILKIRRDISQLREGPEIPVAMGGSFRGEDPSLSGTSGVRYSGTDCYVKSVTIRH